MTMDTLRRTHKQQSFAASWHNALPLKTFASPFAEKFERPRMTESESNGPGQAPLLFAFLVPACLALLHVEHSRPIQTK